jgi:hypothetical protein
MQGEPPGWDAQSVYYSFDLTTRFTVMYLVISAVVFLVLAIRFLPILRLFKSSATLLRRQTAEHSDADSQRDKAESSATLRFKTACVAIQVALVAVRRWVQLTGLILIAYSATEIADEFRRISISKMTGISALSGLLGQIVSMWVVALWFMVALCIASWILGDRLMRCVDLRADSRRERFM